MQQLNILEDFIADRVKPALGQTAFCSDLEVRNLQQLQKEFFCTTPRQHLWIVIFLELHELLQFLSLRKNFDDFSQIVSLSGTKRCCESKHRCLHEQFMNQWENHVLVKANLSLRLEHLLPFHPSLKRSSSHGICWCHNRSGRSRYFDCAAYSNIELPSSSCFLWLQCLSQPLPSSWRKSLLAPRRPTSRGASLRPVPTGRWLARLAVLKSSSPQRSFRTWNQQSDCQAHLSNGTSSQPCLLVEQDRDQCRAMPISLCSSLLKRPSGELYLPCQKKRQQEELCLGLCFHLSVAVPLLLWMVAVLDPSCLSPLPLQGQG